MRNKHIGSLFFMVLLHLIMITFTASAQNGGDPSFEPAAAIDLGISSLHLTAGETYTFSVTYEPEDTVFRTLDWSVTNEKVISIDPLTDTVTALTDGEARIFAVTQDRRAYAVCDVTVGTSVPKDITVMKSGEEYFGLTGKEMRKISSGILRPYLDFIAGSPMDEENYTKLSGRSFDVLAAVRPGTEEAESRRARELGITSDPLTSLNTVTLTGTAAQILSFVKDNKDLREVFDLGAPMLPEPVEEQPEDELTAKTFKQWGNAEKLSNISYAHKLGLTGKGRTIAVIDTGIDSKHEQVAGRVIREACFSIGGSGYNSACSNNAVRTGAANPSRAKKPVNFNHGMHVTGIAAGKDGVAPEANIIFIAAASEYQWTCKQSEKARYACSKGSSKCCSATFPSTNQAKAYDHLIKLAEEGLKIDAVNISLGGGEYKGVCDSQTKYRKEFFDKMIKAGILPVVSAGNSKYNDAVGMPACVSSAYTVAALADNKAPYIAAYSNFNKTNVSIAAPGTNIYSSVNVSMNKNFQITCRKNCYAKKSGTSMAAPMVTGAAALVKQLYPDKTPDEAGKFLKETTSKYVNKRTDNNNKPIHTWGYSKPVLNFNNILNDFSIPDSSISAMDQKVTIVFSDPGVNASFNYKVNIINAAAQTKVPFQFRITTSGNTKTIEIDGKGNFTEGNLYRLELTRIMKGSKKGATAVRYFSPFAPMKSLTAAVRDKGVGLNLYSRSQSRQFSVVYTVYNAENKQAVKRISAKNDDLPQTVTGLTNGQKYYVTARPFRNAAVNNRTYTLWGMETDPVYFVPLSAPFNCQTAAWSIPQLTGQHYTKISCSADPQADGIAVFYRNYDDNNSTLKFGCRSEKGQPFQCQIDGIDRDGKYQFFPVKYISDNSSPSGFRFGKSAVINHNCKNESDLTPDKTMIYVKEPNNTTVISAAESEAKGISAYLFDSGGNPVENAFCDQSGRACDNQVTDTGGASAFFIMRWIKDTDGKRICSPGIYASNLWSAH